MRHYTDRNGSPLTPAAHTGHRVHITAKLRERNPDVILAFGADGRLFYGDSPEDYAGAEELSCRNCIYFAAADSIEPGATVDGCTVELIEPLMDHNACEDWESRK